MSLDQLARDFRAEGYTYAEIAWTLGASQLLVRCWCNLGSSRATKEPLRLSGDVAKSAVPKLFESFRESLDDLPAAVLTVAMMLERNAPLGEPPIGNSEYLSIKQAAREFNLSERALYNLTDLHLRRGRTVRIKRKDLQAHLEGQETLF